MNHAKNKFLQSVATENRVEELVLEAIHRAPDRCAFRYQGFGLTCEALLTKSRALATELHQSGLKAGEPVVLHLDHSLNLPIAVIGVLLAGGCVAAVDPQLDKRLRGQIFKTVAPRFIIAEEPLDFDFGGRVTRIHPEWDSDNVSDSGDFRGLHSTEPNHPAFLVFTSGTTGLPRGVEISHEAYVIRMRHITANKLVCRDVVDLMWTPSSFIGMLDELFYPLIMGITSVIAPPKVRTDPLAFADIVESESITQVRMTPSLLDAILRSGIGPRIQSLRTVFCSGEALSSSTKENLFSTLSATLWNFYGATEAPGVAYRRIDRNDPPSELGILESQLFADVQIRGQDDRPVELGETGQVWIGGPVTATRYWHAPEKTNATILSQQGKRWFRTGDLGRRLSGQRFEILGRADYSQTKIRGIPIDLVAVAEAMRNLESVDAATVLPFINRSGNTELVGHYVPNSRIRSTPDSVRNQLKETLVGSHIPKHLLAHRALPLLSNGKLDLQTLENWFQEWNQKEQKDRTETSPMDGPISASFELESRMVILFRQVLQDDAISISDDFYRVGGDSLQSMILASLASDAFEVKISMEDVMQAPSARLLAKLVAGRQSRPGRRSFATLNDAGDRSLFTIGLLNDELTGDFGTQSLYSASGIWGDPNFDPTCSFDHLVEQYEHGIREKNRHDSWSLVGFSLGGLVAFEIARRQILDRSRLKNLVLIEPLTPNGTFVERQFFEAFAFAANRWLKRDRGPMKSFAARLAVQSAFPIKLIGSSWGAYGHTVAGTHQLSAYEGSVSLVCRSCFPESYVNQWKSVVSGDFKVLRLPVKDHLDLVKRNAIMQWKELALE